MNDAVKQLVKEVINHKNFTENEYVQANQVYVDTVCAIIYGVNNDPEMIHFLNERALDKEEICQTSVPIVGSSYFLHYKDALLLYGTACVSNELDEGSTLTKGHPASHIIPILLVKAYMNDTLTQDVLDILIQAYEISSRYASAINSKSDVHPHGTWGMVGGAVAAALLNKKTAQEIIDTISLALSLPLATSWYAAESGQNVRNLYSGFGSMIAFDLPDMNHYGFESNMMTVEHIWGNILGVGIDYEKLNKNLLEPSMICLNYFKRFPTCRFTHASIDATLDICSNNKIILENIQKITVETYNLAARCDIKLPTSKLQSKFSIPYAVACVIFRLDLFDDYKNNLEIIKEFTQKIDVVESKEMTSFLPEIRMSKVSIETIDGKMYTRSVEVAKGEYSNRISKEALYSKFRKLLSFSNIDNKSDKYLNDLYLSGKNTKFQTWIRRVHLDPGGDIGDVKG